MRMADMVRRVCSTGMRRRRSVRRCRRRRGSRRTEGDRRVTFAWENVALPVKDLMNLSSYLPKPVWVKDTLFIA